MELLSGQQIAFLLGAAIVAELVSTLAGFGASTILLPLATFVLPFPVALLLAGLVDMTGNISKSFLFRESFRWKFILWLGLPAVGLTFVGAALVPFLTTTLLTRLLGVGLIVYVLATVRWPQWKFTPRHTVLATVGGLSGFLAGLLGVGGALRSAALNAFNLEKGRYLVTASVISLMVEFTRNATYVGSGIGLSRQLQIVLPFLIAIGIAGTLVGKRLVDRIPQHRFRPVVLVALAAVAVKLIISG